MIGEGARAGRHTASRARTLSMHTDDSMVAAVRRVEANPDNVEISMANGFNVTPYQLIGSGLLAHPTRAVMYDWSHCYLQDGLADHEFGQFMSQFRSVAVYSELRDYCSQFAPPRQHPSLDALFEPSRVRQALKMHKFKCDCSELATLAPLIARYVREVIRAPRFSVGGQSFGPLGPEVSRSGTSVLSPRVSLGGCLALGQRGRAQYGCGARRVRVVDRRAHAGQGAATRARAGDQEAPGRL